MFFLLLGSSRSLVAGAYTRTALKDDKTQRTQSCSSHLLSVSLCFKSTSPSELQFQLKLRSFKTHKRVHRSMSWRNAIACAHAFCFVTLEGATNCRFLASNLLRFLGFCSFCIRGTILWLLASSIVKWKNGRHLRWRYWLK